MISRPIFFEKNRVARVYTGGRLFDDFLGDGSTDGFYPEEWIASGVRALNKGSTDTDKAFFFFPKSTANKKRFAAHNKGRANKRNKE